MRKLHLIFGFLLVGLSISCSNAQVPNTATATAPVEKPQRTSFEYMRDGSAAFLNGSYDKAIEPFQKALDLEKQDRKLEKNLWFALIDNLAMAYGITGDLKNSRLTLEYGISKEPEYPMFYYIMANTYGEENDEPNAIKYLRIAFKHQKNMVAGEAFPDPLVDDSFKNFADSPTFKKAVVEMKKEKK